MSMTLDRAVVEFKEFTRSREQMIFIFAFPIIFLLLFGTIFGGDEIAPDVTFAQYFLAGMIASGILNTGFQSLAISISIDRDEDRLKRIHATPLPATSYFTGKVLQVLAVSIIQIALLVTLGMLLYGVTLPSEASTWWTFTWVFLLGTAASTTVGIATSSLLRNGKAASAILTPVVLFLQFTSGVFFVFTQLPEWLQSVAEVFPLKWLAQGMRSVFLPEYFASQEAAGTWQHPLTAIVLTVWAILGLVVAVRTFRWMRHDDN
jgi:ABC-2 type transport system permease protein